MDSVSTGRIVTVMVPSSADPSTATLPSAVLDRSPRFLIEKTRLPVFGRCYVRPGSDVLAWADAGPLDCL